MTFLDFVGAAEASDAASRQTTIAMTMHSFLTIICVCRVHYRPAGPRNTASRPLLHCAIAKACRHSLPEPTRMSCREFLRFEKRLWLAHILLPPRRAFPGERAAWRYRLVHTAL